MKYEIPALGQAQAGVVFDVDESTLCRWRVTPAAAEGPGPQIGEYRQARLGLICQGGPTPPLGLVWWVFWSGRASSPLTPHWRGVRGGLLGVVCVRVLVSHVAWRV